MPSIATFCPCIIKCLRCILSSLSKPASRRTRFQRKPEKSRAVQTRPGLRKERKSNEGGSIFVRATGIVRRIDELGRVVIPKEIRRTLRIREGDPQLTVLENEQSAEMLITLLAGVIEQRKKYA